jgi:hypothetical protein
MTQPKAATASAFLLHFALGAAAGGGCKWKMQHEPSALHQRAKEIAHSVSLTARAVKGRRSLSPVLTFMLLQVRLVRLAALLTLPLALANITQPSNCGPASGRFSASAFSSVVESFSGKRDSATQVYEADSVSVVLIYNGEVNQMPTLGPYALDLPPPAHAISVASAHMELRDKKNASLILERTQSVVFWTLPQGTSAADWRPTPDDIELMVKLSQHLKGRGELHDAMQASRCAFDKQQPRTFQSVTARIEFISALAALSPSQHAHIHEALDLAAQLQVSSSLELISRS